MTGLSLQEAVEPDSGRAGRHLQRAIQVGTLSAKKTDDGGFAIDPSDLFCVFETKADRSMFHSQRMQCPLWRLQDLRNERNGDG